MEICSNIEYLEKKCLHNSGPTSTERTYKEVAQSCEKYISSFMHMHISKTLSIKTFVKYWKSGSHLSWIKEITFKIGLMIKIFLMMQELNAFMWYKLYLYK